jgi:hypothetical protein
MRDLVTCWVFTLTRRRTPIIGKQEIQFPVLAFLLPGRMTTSEGKPTSVTGINPGGNPVT